MNSGVDFLIEEVKSNEWQDKFIWHKQDVFDKAKEMEIAGKEMSYAEGYSEGYKRALELIEWMIKTELKRNKD